MRGLTDLERTLLIASKAAQNYIANTESELGMTLKSGDLLRGAIAKAEACALSPDPHASDCEKQGETPCNYIGLCGWKEEIPLDRPADVTETELRSFIYARRHIKSRELARALLATFTVGRR
jgi:hypothetical protein